MFRLRVFDRHTPPTPSPERVPCVHQPEADSADIGCCRFSGQQIIAYVRVQFSGSSSICHCRTEGEARRLWRQVEDRLAECGLTLHPQKTKVVYCKDTNRKGVFPTVAFDFLGYRFQPRLASWRGGLFGVSYLPAVSPKALKAFRRRVRNWGLQRRSDKGLTDLARMFNRQIEGWIGYFRYFYKSALYPTLRLIDAHLVRWVMRKYKRFKQRPRQARLWLARIAKSTPGLFAHWTLLYANG